MARPEEGNSETESRVKRGVARTLRNLTVVIVSLGVIGGWAATGVIPDVQLGEATIVMRLGAFHGIDTKEGYQIHLPAPIDIATRVNTEGLRTETFRGEEIPQTTDDAGDGFVNFVQTGDSNIVNVSYEIQYTIEDPYSFVFGMAQPGEILYEATEAAVREVIGGLTVDEVLTEKKQFVEVRATQLIDETMAEYFKSRGGKTPFNILSLNLQDVYPPQEVRAAFNDVESAEQDRERLVFAAKGDAEEILEKANARAIELLESSEGYKVAKVTEARGEAARFEALLAEYRRAPEVTRRRLYLETMEQVMPGVEKMVVDPSATSVLPLLPAIGPQVTRQGAAGK